MLNSGLDSLPLDDSLACVDIPGLVDDRLLADVNFSYMAKERAQMQQQQQQQQQTAGLMGPPLPVGVPAAASCQGVGSGGQVMSERVQLLASSLQSLSEEDRAYARQQLLLKAQKAGYMQQQGGMAASPSCSSGGSMLSRGVAVNPSAAAGIPVSALMPQMLHGPSRLSSTSPAIESCGAAAGPGGGGCSSSMPMAGSMLETCSAPMLMQDFSGMAMATSLGNGGYGGDLLQDPCGVKQEDGIEGIAANRLMQETAMARAAQEQTEQAFGMQGEPGAYTNNICIGNEGVGQVQRFSPSPSLAAGAGAAACSSPLKRTTAQLASEAGPGAPEETVGSPLKRQCNKILPEPPSFNTLVQAEASEDDLLAWGNSGSLASLMVLGMKSPTDGGTGELLPVQEEDGAVQSMSDADMWAVLTTD
jgi:hypothetical protein